MPGAQRRYGGQSAEARRGERRARLIDAALDVLVSGDWRAVTVDKLCAAAGLNKRYFYESFTDLDAVAAGAIGDIADDIRSLATGTASAVADQPLAARAVAVVTAVVGALADDPRRARALLGAAPVSPALQDYRAELIAGLTAVLVEYARTVHDVELEKDPLAQVAPSFIIGGTGDAILAFVDGRAKVTRDELVQSIATLWLITGNGAAQVAEARRL